MSVDELIAEIKRGGYEYTVNLGDEDETPMTGVSLQEETQLPDKETLSTFSDMFDDVFIKLANTIQDSYGTTRAHKFGEIALNFASVNPKVEANDIPELVSFHGVSEREAKQYITFHELFAGRDYEHDVHIPTAIKLSEVYNVDTAIGLLDVIYAEGIELNDDVFTVWSDVHDEAIDPDEIVEALAEKGVDDIKSGVMAVYVLEASEFPDDLEQQVESKLESIDVTVDSGEPGDDAHGDGGATDTNADMGSDDEIIVDAYLEDIIQAESESETHELIQSVFDDINALPVENKLDTYWQIGYAMKTLKNEIGMNYSTLTDSFDIGISKSYAARTRNLVDVYDYKEYPGEEHNIGLNKIYTVSRESNTTQNVKEQISRLENCEYKIRAKEMQAWGDVESPTPEEVIRACKENGVSITAESVVPIVSLFADNRLSKEDMEPHVDDLVISDTEPQSREGGDTRDENTSVGSENGVLKGFSTTSEGSDVTAAQSAETPSQHEQHGITGDAGEDADGEHTGVDDGVGEGMDDATGDDGETVRDGESRTVTEYVEILQRDSDVVVDDDENVVRTQDRRYKQTLEELFSPTIPCENVCELLNEFTALHPVRTGNGFWEAYIESHTEARIENATEFDVGDNESVTWGAEDSDVTWVDAAAYDTPYDVANHTDTPLLLTHPERASMRTQKHVASAVTTYIANGGDKIVYIGDSTQSDGEQPVLDAIRNVFTVKTVATPLQWETNNDAVTVFTRDGDADSVTGDTTRHDTVSASIHEVMK